MERIANARNFLVYLGCPYSHHDPAVMAERFEAVNLAAGHLMCLGIHVFSPISHTHPIALAGSLPRGWDFWREYDTLMLSACRAMVVLTLGGWMNSVGLAAEMKLAGELGIPIEMTSNEPDALRMLAKHLRGETR
jgi:hypothetical protein